MINQWIFPLAAIFALVFALATLARVRARCDETRCDRPSRPHSRNGHRIDNKITLQRTF